VEIDSSAADTYRALATVDGLAAWWTAETRGRSAVGDVIEFRFGERGGFDMKVLELAPEKRVLWQVVNGPKEWLGTRVGFGLDHDGRYTAVRFKHEGWPEAADFMSHCSTKWAMFLMSLKSRLETGTGAPYPRDVHITCKDD
jgi:uncharacterized protein YndB with AHSA1/START domain